MNKGMVCPHCGKVFPVSERQLNNNMRFRCGWCGGYNDGCSETDEHGNYIGCVMSKADRDAFYGKD